MSVSKKNSVNNSKINTKNLFFSFPPPLEENHSSQAFHRTLGAPLSPQNPPSFHPNNLSSTSNQQIPILPLHPNFQSPPLSAVKTTENHRNSGTLSLMSCTEGLGFESSDDIISSSFNNLGSSKNENPNNSSPLIACSTSYCLRKNLEEKKFPPPLTSGNFVLKSLREDGRLRIVGVLIKRPEFLSASRDNGRLRLNLIQNISSDDDDDDHGSDDDDDDDDDEIIDEKEKEEKWKINLQQQRCFEREMHVWGPQNHHRCVTIV